MAVKKIKFKNHDEWLEIRKHYIGGSDAAAVIGMSNYKSAYSLWAEKTGKIEGFAGNLITDVGAYLEDFVAHQTMKDLGIKVRRENHILVNDLYPFAHASIDRAVVGENAFLEIKTTNSQPIMKSLRKSDDFPEAYYAQCVHYMAVGNFDKCYLAVLVNCREMMYFEMDRDQEEIDALMAAEKDFWNCVETDTPPAVDGHESTTDALKKVYAQSTDDVVNLTMFERHLDSYKSIDNHIEELEQQRDGLGNIIKEFMKEAGKGESLKYRVSYVTRKRRTFDHKQFAKDCSFDLTPWMKESESRSFKVTEK